MVDQVLQALAEPRRREILKLIRLQEMSAGEIASHFDVTRPAISQHLGVLSSAGLVTIRRQGTSRFYRIRPEGLADVRQFIEGFWDDRLELLVQEAEAEERRIKEMTSVQSDVVVREVRVAARPETIFSFLTDPAMMARW
ncbi:MAG TPA: metalloregulator ArsR/SmtB family transcription factor, partial [Nitrolancea sp.]|nr:metalloregulator ArsR/SmtB family transcription factor [Nitrolancea sp.]